MRDLVMAILLDPPFAKSSIAGPEIEDQPVTQALLPKPAPVKSEAIQGSSLDGGLIWLCINCGLLLIGMHVYELIVWFNG
jgi:hypothetical protein